MNGKRHQEQDKQKQTNRCMSEKFLSVLNILVFK